MQEECFIPFNPTDDERKIIEGLRSLKSSSPKQNITITIKFEGASFDPEHLKSEIADSILKALQRARAG